jgi:hypothetical protein
MATRSRTFAWSCCPAPASQAPHLLLEAKRSDRHCRLSLLRLPARSVLLDAGYQSSAHGFNTQLAVGSALRFNANSTAPDRNSRQQLRFSLNGDRLTGRLVLQGPSATGLVDASGKQVLRFVLNPKVTSLQVGPRFSLQLRPNDVSLVDGKTTLARLAVTRPTENTLSTRLVWRPQRMLTTVNDLAQVVDGAISRTTGRTVAAASTRLTALRKAAARATLVPLDDLGRFTAEAARAIGVEEAAFAVGSRLRDLGRSTLRMSADSGWALVSASTAIRLQDRFARLRLRLRALLDGVTTLQQLPDVYARRLGAAANRLVQKALRAAIEAMQRVQLSGWAQRRPAVQDVLPFEMAEARTALRRLKQSANSDAIGLLRGMQHLDRSVHELLAVAFNKLLVVADAFDLERELELALELAEPLRQRVRSGMLKRQLLAGLSTIVALSADSPLVANYILDVRHRLSEYSRAVLGATVPRVQQLNWRHGRVHIVWHLPLRPILPALPPPPMRPDAPSFTDAVRQMLPQFSQFKEQRASLRDKGGRLVIDTFDTLVVRLPLRCSPLPLAAFQSPVRPEFSWDVRFVDGSSRSVQLRLGARRFVFNDRYQLHIDGQRTASLKGRYRVLGTHTAEVWKSRAGRINMFLRNTFGLALEMDPGRGFVQLRLLSPHYFGKIEGLFGNADRVSANDYPSPNTYDFLKNKGSKCPANGA